MPHRIPVAESQTVASPEAGLDVWQECLDRLDVEVNDWAGTGKYPEWFYQEDWTTIHDVDNQLKANPQNAEYVSRYFDLYTRGKEHKAIISGQEPAIRPLQNMIYDLGEDVVGRGFAVEPADGPLHVAMLSTLEQEGDTRANLTPELDVLKVAYATDSLTELLGVTGEKYDDKLRTALLQPNPMYTIQLKELPNDTDGGQGAEAARTWMSQALEAATGMPASEAYDYVFTASGKSSTLSQDTGNVINKVNHFGLDGIRQLADFSGIQSLEAYNAGQLERMLALVNDPAQAAEGLAQHDVTVMMINRAGDPSNVLRDVAADFDDSNKRTLFFEISSMADIFRHMLTLERVGIQPSTLVLAAHSAPGQFIVSDKRNGEYGKQRYDIATVAGRKLVKLVNGNGDLNPGEYGYAMHDMKGVARLIENYMKPSRGIDDASHDRGRKKIIFSACQAATEITARDLDEEGKKAPFGLESVISQLGKDLVASGVKSSVDIYGAPGGVQMRRTDRGVQYSGHLTGFDDSRPHLTAERVRVENGRFDKQEVQDIILRK